MPVMASPDPAPMQRRSWYLPAETADRLAAVVNDIHYRTRRPKHEVLSAVAAVALDHQPEILDRLTRADGAA